MTTLVANKAIIRKVIAAINTRNLEVLDELIAHDFAFQTHHIRGLDAIKRVIEEEVTGFPDLNLTIEDIAAEADKVWLLRIRVLSEGYSPRERRCRIRR